MRGWAMLALVALVGCESVSGLSELEFEPEPEPCEPEPDETTCANVACGAVQNNCGQEVTCPDTCLGLTACEVGGVPANTCGCTGGANLTPEIPNCTATPGLTGNTYYVCQGTTANLEGAREGCQVFGADLPIITSQAENDFILGLITANAWIGLVDETSCASGAPPCDFAWVDGSAYEGLFDNFNPGEPNNSQGGEHCVEMQRSASAPAIAGGWNDVPCSNSLQVVCETTCGPL